MARKKKKIILLILVVSISVGFAFVSTNLIFNSIFSFNRVSWNLYLDNVTVDPSSIPVGENGSPPQIIEDNLSVTYTVSYTQPGDYYIFYVDLVNDGSLDAYIDSAEVLGIDDDYRINNLFYYDCMYLDDTIMNIGDVIPKGERVTLKITTGYKENINNEDMLDNDLDFTLTFSATAKQKPTDSVTSSTFDTGQNLVSKMISLSNSPLGSAENHIDGTAKVTAFRHVSYLIGGLTSDNIVSISGSDYPIYMWFDEDYASGDGTGTIYWYCQADIVYFNPDSRGLFYYDTDDDMENYSYFTLLSDISGVARISTAKVTDASYMFAECESLSDIKYLRTWNISRVTNLSAMFARCFNLSDINSLSKWDTSSVEEMSVMFYECTSLSNMDPISNFDYGSVVNMDGTFANTAITNCSFLSGADFTSVETVESLFLHCVNLSDISGLYEIQTPKLENTSSMFRVCTSLTEVYALGTWDFSNVTDMSHMFSDCTSLVNIYGLGNISTDSVVSLRSMFEGCSSLIDVSPLASFDVTHVNDIRAMFYDCSSLIDASSLNGWWATTPVGVDMNSAFPAGIITPSWYV